MHKELPAQCVLTVTSLTSDISSEQHLAAVIQPSTHYQLIPASPETTSHLTPLIPTLLNESKGKILDVCLPYQRNSKSIHNQYYLGRYIFIDGMLVAIRLASSEANKYANYPHSHLIKWPKKMVEEVSLPGQFVKYRPKETCKKGRVFIGDFILELKNAILGLLFLSEVHQNPNIVNEYLEAGVTIISIVDDTVHPNSNSGQINNITYKAPNRTVTNLRPTHIYKNMLIFGGMIYSTLEQVYMSIGVIASDNKIDLGSSMLANDTCLSVVCSLPTKKDINNESIDLESTPMFSVNFDFPTSKQNFPNKVTKTIVGSKIPELDKIPKKFDNLVPLLKLLYLFKHVNKGQPFVLPSSISTNLVIELNKLKSLLDKNIEDIFWVYKCKSGNQQIGSWINKIKIYESLEQLIIEKSQNILYVYTNENKQLSSFQVLAVKYPNVRICSELLSKVTNAKQNCPRNQQLHKINNFMDEVIKTPIYDLSQILKIARSQKFKLNKEQIIQAVTIRLKDKYRQCFSMSPLANYFLDNEPSVIERDLVDAEVSLAYNEGGIRMYTQKQERQSTKSKQVIQHPPHQNKPERSLFTKTLEDARKIKKRLSSRKQVKCHSCKLYMESSFIHHCKTCEIDACLVCIGQLGKLTEKNKKDYQKCIVCQKLCRCTDCKKQFQLQYKDLFQPIQAEQQQVTIYKPAGIDEDTCSRCLVIGRTINNIKVMCDRCVNRQCLACLKQARKLKDSYKWICSSCRDNDETMQNEIAEPNSQKMEVQKVDGQQIQISRTPEKIIPFEVHQLNNKMLEQNENRPKRKPFPALWVNKGLFQLPKNIPPPKPKQEPPSLTTLNKNISKSRCRSNSSKSSSSSSSSSSYKNRKNYQSRKRKSDEHKKNNKRAVYVKRKISKRSYSSSSSSNSSGSSFSRSRSRQNNKSKHRNVSKNKDVSYKKEHHIQCLNTKSSSKFELSIKGLKTQVNLKNILDTKKPLWKMANDSQKQKDMTFEKRKFQIEPRKQFVDSCILPSDRYMSTQDFDY